MGDELLCTVGVTWLEPHDEYNLSHGTVEQQCSHCLLFLPNMHVILATKKINWKFKIKDWILCRYKSVKQLQSTVARNLN